MKTLDDIGFRIAESGDAAAMAACRAGDPSGPADPRMKAYLDGEHHPQKALPPRRGVVALDGERIIAYIAGHRTTRHGCEGELQYLFVKREYRRRGIATELLSQLASWFLEEGVRHVCVAIAGDSPPEAEPFVESRGATPLKRYWHAWPDIAGAVNPDPD